MMVRWTFHSCLSLFHIHGVNRLYSEMMDYSDCDCHCEASEYEEVTTITYKSKKV